MTKQKYNDVTNNVLENSRRIASILLFIFLIALVVGVLKGDLIEVFLNGKTL